jgi:uncharacterized membrane-anchored protein YhcB (DUF1043 family)
MEKIYEKLDKLDNRLYKIDTHLAVYNQQLAEHIRRTELLEKEVEPIKAHVIVVSSLAKILAGISLVIGIIMGLLKLSKELQSPVKNATIQKTLEPRRLK